MKRLPIVLLILVAGIFLTFQTLGSDGNPPSRYERIMKNVSEMLTQGHYSPKDINDEFSKKVFIKYIEQLDSDKNILLKSDIELLRKHETLVDDELKGAPVQFFLDASSVFNSRMEEASTIYHDILARPFDFTIQEEVDLDSDRNDFASNNEERKEMWRKRLKYLTLERYVDLLDTREKNKDKKDFEMKSDASLEKEARAKVETIMERTFDRYRFKFNEEEKFNLYVNTITTTMDPHTTFFPPVDKRYFDEEMSGRFFGIGASLQYEDGNIKIASLITGSPAWKSGEIQVGDVITKVAQGSQEPVDLTGYMTQDAVKIIRGKKGTEVKLTLKKTNGTEKVVTIIRDEIVQDETFARSAIVKSGATKIGYIYLPEFYADFENPKGARSYVDVAKEIIKLKEENVNGIVMDLRGNGGGSLIDVVQMAGLFIEEGPIVQVKDRDGNPSILRDKDNKTVLYDGPLAVMVNELSASASEIFAAAIQDYNRGVIIGSTSTFGKGTVQRNIGLDPGSNFLSSNSELGTIKLTLQKFYRINGGSTQLKGVYPDIILPDNLEYLKFREKDDPDALPWDEIPQASYTKWNSGYNLNSVKQLSEERVSKNLAFNTIKETSEWLSEQNNKKYSLHIDQFRKDIKAIRDAVSRSSESSKLPYELNVSALPQETAKFANDTNKQERFQQWLTSLRKDIYLDQSIKTLTDMI
ncbi:MAG: carboxy terminal-processing peptidase, partial [Chitinophagaceae bacterium]|nr:carboxy terminal-processing peptidase [Chitinophagaceae bacterium]